MGRGSGAAAKVAVRAAGTAPEVAAAEGAAAMAAAAEATVQLAEKAATEKVKIRNNFIKGKVHFSGGNAHLFLIC